MNNQDVVANRFSTGFVAKNSGNSHFTIDKNPNSMGTHITTSVPGLNLGQSINIKNQVDRNGNVS